MILPTFSARRAGASLAVTRLPGVGVGRKGDGGWQAMSLDLLALPHTKNQLSHHIQLLAAFWFMLQYRGPMGAHRGSYAGNL